MIRYMERIIAFCCNLIWVSICFPSYVNFEASGRFVAWVQKRILLKIIKRNRKTCLGLKYDFSTIQKLREFQQRLPVTTYEDYFGYIARIKKGEEHILTFDKVVRLIPTSGSSAASKYIPYTSALKKEFLRGIRSWVFALYTANRELFWGKHYWSITPLGEDIMNHHKGGVPVDFGQDGDYFSRIERIILSLLLVIPQDAGKIRDIKSLRYVSLLYLLTERELRFVSIWNPLFFTLMLRDLPGLFPQLLNDLNDRRIHESIELPVELRCKLERKIHITERRLAELKVIYDSWKTDPGGLLFNKIWPHLRVISCWASANATHCIQELSRMFPNVAIEPKGLMATEGIVSLPLFENYGDSRFLAITSHFYEFLEMDTNESFCVNSYARLACELEVGKKYMVLLTTSGGLYRYNLQDIIEVTGFKGKVPLVKFIGKADYISDLAGEKLNAFHVEGVLHQLFAESGIQPLFYLLAPEQNGNHSYTYTLFMQVNDQDRQKIAFCPERLDTELSKNFHYRYCRKLGQLVMARIFLISAAELPEQVYFSHMALKKSVKGSTMKIPVLSKELEWSKVFQGEFIGLKAMAESNAAGS